MHAKAHEKLSIISEKYKNKSPGSWTSNWPFWTQVSFSLTNWTANAIMNGIAKIPKKIWGRIFLWFSAGVQALSTESTILSA